MKQKNVFLQKLVLILILDIFQNWKRYICQKKQYRKQVSRVIKAWLQERNPFGVFQAFALDHQYTQRR